MTDIISTSMSISIAMLSFVIGAVGSLLLRNKEEAANWWGNVCAFTGSVFGLITSALVLLQDQTFVYTLPTSFPFLSFSLRIDHLSAFFIFIISLSGVICSLYAIGYVKHFYHKYSLGALGFFYNLFILGMIMVAMASNAIFFLIAWELMSLASYFLVIFERDKEENVRAGYVYFVMTHLGTAFIMGLFLVLYYITGSFEFSAIREQAMVMPPALKTAALLLALVGFGTKAGIIPFHIWLPGAHPSAPSHVSALMSGVMIKTGIYMFMRISLDLFSDVPLWWGLLLMILGSVSAVLGILYAISESDIKKLLAYSSIENIGIILLGLGSALTFFALDIPMLATTGLVASLYHVLNHSLFKSLLFLGAGAVISKTHTLDMEKYGGLIRYMPRTAFLFLIGSLAISALPPFNGFFSEWMTFQSLFSGIGSFGMFTKWIFVFAASSLAITGGLAAACFVKAFGIIFLARPRSEEIKKTQDPSVLLQAGMGVFAALALVAGVFSSNITRILSSVVEKSGFVQDTAAVSARYGHVVVRGDFSVVSMPAVLFSLLLVTLVTALVVYFFTQERKVKIGKTWDCGTAPNSRMEITSLGFSRALLTIFGGILKPTEQTEVEYKDANMRYFSRINVTDYTRDIYREYFYRPLQNGIVKIARNIKRIQTGNVNVYVLYILIALIGLLIFAAL